MYIYIYIYIYIYPVIYICIYICIYISAAMLLINEEKFDYKKVTDKDMPMAKKLLNPMLEKATLNSTQHIISGGSGMR